MVGRESGLGRARVARPHGRPRERHAQLVGLSLDAMKASLGDGRSLLDVASSRGVSAATVTSTIARAIAPAMGSGQGGLTAQVASRIASHHRA